MNIKNDLAERLVDIIRKAGKMSPLQIKGSVQPSIDYHKVMAKHKTVTIATAGNVITNIIPGKGKKTNLIMGQLKLTNDATVANRDLHLKSLDLNDNEFGDRIIDNLAASQIGYIIVDRHSVEEAISWRTSNINGILGVPNGIPTYEEDYLSVYVTLGQAGDVLTGALKFLEEEIPLEI